MAALMLPGRAGHGPRTGGGLLGHVEARSSAAAASGSARRTSTSPRDRGAAHQVFAARVAVLAHISTEYYIRLEQGRAPRPSGAVLAAIAGALRFTDAESDHLHVLAGTGRTASDCAGAMSAPASSRSWSGCRRPPAS